MLQRPVWLRGQFARRGGITALTRLFATERREKIFLR